MRGSPDLKKIPELAGSIGKALKEFKKGVSDATEEARPRPLVGSRARGTALRSPIDERVLSAAKWTSPDDTVVPREVVMHGIQLRPPS